MAQYTLVVKGHISHNKKSFIVTDVNQLGNQSVTFLFCGLVTVFVVEQMKTEPFSRINK